MLVPIIVFLFYPAWASSMGAPHNPLVKVSGRQQRYLLRDEWRSHLEDTGRSSLLLYTWDLHEAMEVQEPMAGALGAVAVTPQELGGQESVRDFCIIVLGWVISLAVLFD